MFVNNGKEGGVCRAVENKNKAETEDVKERVGKRQSKGPEKEKDGEAY